MEQWWYVVSGERKGPVTSEELVQLARGGSIALDTLIWRSGAPDWFLVSSVPELASIIPIPPPVPSAGPQLSSNNGRILSTKEGSLLHEPVVPSQTKDVVGLDYSPWRRYLAKMLDLLLAIFVLSVACVGLAFISPAFQIWLQNPQNATLSGIAFLLMAPIIEATISTVFDNSPGKALLGIKIFHTDGGKLDFSSQLSRNYRVLWYGMGAYVPIFALFAMVHQYRKLQNIGQTGYDAGRCIATSTPISWFRYAIVVAIIVPIFGAFKYLEHETKDEDRQFYAGRVWINPFTQHQVDIPGGWAVSTQKNSLGQEFYAFTRPAEELQVIFGREEVRASMDLSRYLAAFVRAVGNDMAFVPPGQTGSLGLISTLTLHGAMTDDASQRLSATFLHAGDSVWRTVGIRLRGKEPETDAYLTLRDRLLRSAVGIR